jgi:hypothetical protein
MSDFIPKAPDIKTRGLGRAAQKLQAAREKADHAKNSGNPLATSSTTSAKAKDSFAGSKKTTFQRKAV